MKILKTISESVMVLEFLRAEKQDRIPPDFWPIIDRANLQSEEENQVRAHLLASVRGYGQNDAIFNGFPQDVSWYEAELDTDDMNKLLYIDYDNWVAASHGTRLAKDFADRCNKAEHVPEINQDKIRGIQSSIERGVEIDKPIVVAVDSESPLVLLEGHHRATAYLCQGSKTMKVILGFSKDMRNWVLY